AMPRLRRRTYSMRRRCTSDSSSRREARSWMRRSDSLQWALVPRRSISWTRRSSSSDAPAGVPARRASTSTAGSRRRSMFGRASGNAGPARSVGLDDVVGGELPVHQPRQALDRGVVARQHRPLLLGAQARAGEHRGRVLLVGRRQRGIAAELAHEIQQCRHVPLPRTAQRPLPRGGSPAPGPSKQKTVAQADHAADVKAPPTAGAAAGSQGDHARAATMGPMNPRDPTGPGAGYFHGGGVPVPTPLAREWNIAVADGPVVATAIHDGHDMRPSLRSHAALDDAARFREEDPLTGLLTEVGDVRIQVRRSRFEVDHNRPRDRAVYARPEDCWGLQAWRAPLPEVERAQSLAAWDRFRAMVTELVDRLLE